MTSCPECAAEQAVAEATFDESDTLEAVYTCREGCGPILIVSTPGVVPWEGRGYRMGDWMIRNPKDLFIRPAGRLNVVVLPASPHALD